MNKHRIVFEVTTDVAVQTGMLMVAISEAVSALMLSHETRIVLLEDKKIFEGVVPSRENREDL